MRVLVPAERRALLSAVRLQFRQRAQSDGLVSVPPNPVIQQIVATEIVRPQDVVGLVERFGITTTEELATLFFHGVWTYCADGVSGRLARAVADGSCCAAMSLLRGDGDSSVLRARLAMASWAMAAARILCRMR